MPDPRDIRRLAFQALYQIDARGEVDLEELKAAAAESDLKPAEITKAIQRATAAFGERDRADAAMLKLAPGWPAHRQAAVDRAILRLAHYEMAARVAPPKIVINEAVELAKSFSTEKSPAFINGLLDKVYKQLIESGAVTPDAAPTPTGVSPDESLS